MCDTLLKKSLTKYHQVSPTFLQWFLTSISLFSFYI